MFLLLQEDFETFCCCCCFLRRPNLSRQASRRAIRSRSDGARLEKSKLLAVEDPSLDESRVLLVDDEKLVRLLRLPLQLLVRKDLRKRNEPMSRNCTSSEIVGKLLRLAILLVNDWLLFVWCAICRQVVRFCLIGKIVLRDGRRWSLLLVLDCSMRLMRGSRSTSFISEQLLWDTPIKDILLGFTLLVNDRASIQLPALLFNLCPPKLSEDLTFASIWDATDKTAHLLLSHPNK